MTLSPQKVDFEAIWGSLAERVGKIVTLTGVKGMPMFEDIYKLCTAQPQPYSEELYLRLKQFLEKHVDQLRESTLACQSDLLTDYLKKWETYSIGTEYCHHIFRYLNQNWIRKRLEDSRNKIGGLYQGPSSTTEVYEVMTLALVIWRDRVFVKVKERIMKAVQELITRDRDGEQINQGIVTGIVQSYVKLGSINKNKPLEIYKEDFETPFLSNTREYYSRESTAFIASCGVSAYLKKAETRIEEETQRAKKFLDPSSYDKLRKEIDMTLIDKHKEILQVECEMYLRDDNIEDLSRMYRLFSRIDDGIKPMLEVLQSYTTTTGFEKVKSIPAAQAKDPKTYVETLLDIYKHFSEVVKKAFANDPAFIAALDKACRKVVNENTINKNSTKSPELLAKYCDLLLKKGNKNIEEAELEDKLNQIITIFKYVDDKDVFQKFYSKMLARRLIHATSVSDDAESIMIGGLKQVCGFEYTSKLQRMFTDITLSTDLNDKFKDHMSTKHLDTGKVEFSILVLTAGSWPLQTQSSNFNVPLELEKCVNLFQEYYNTQHHGRKLNWLHHLSKGDLRTLYLKKKYELQVTNYQMGVLLMFNVNETLSLDEIRRTTNLKDSELNRTLQSLIEAKLVDKQPPGEDYQPTHTFTLLKDFQNKRLKLKITTALQSETKEENEETHKLIEDDRKLFLQAAIVRIMKARKVLNHVNLVQEVIEQARIRFQPNIPMIKKCIEHLIEKEYLQRMEGETDKYSYVA